MLLSPMAAARTCHIFMLSFSAPGLDVSYYFSTLAAVNSHANTVTTLSANMAFQKE